MRTMFDAGTRSDVVGRIAKLAPGKSPLWGQFNAQQVVVHLTSSLRTALGEMRVAPKKTIFRFYVMKKVLIYWAPWPKGAPTAPEFIPPKTGDWTRSKAELEAAMERFAANGVDGKWADHPAFGSLSGKDWGALQWRHFDHHLRQFGV